MTLEVPQTAIKHRLISAKAWHGDTKATARQSRLSIGALERPHAHAADILQPTTNHHPYNPVACYQP